MSPWPREGSTDGVVALAGGVGGSKLAVGLYDHVGERLTVVVNTGDDENMLGLQVCPDLDTMRYTLAGMASPDTGWGIAGDTFHALDQLQRYGLETWFRLGDRDLATNLVREQRLRDGLRLTEVEAFLDERSGLRCRLLPMCDEPVATRITTDDGELSFQEYFVKRHHADAVRAIRYEGIDRASMTDEVRRALTEARAIVLCPSNPLVSIGPILAVPGLRRLLVHARTPIVAVSPIVGRQAVSGPAGQMMEAAGYEVSVLGLAEAYRDFLTGMIVDEADAGEADALRARGLRTLVTRTVMRTGEDKRRLAGDILRWLNEA